MLENAGCLHDLSREHHAGEQHKPDFSDQPERADTGHRLPESLVAGADAMSRPSHPFICPRDSAASSADVAALPCAAMASGR